MAASPLPGIAVDPACSVAVDTTLRTLEEAGHHVLDLPLALPPIDEVIGTFRTLWNAAAAGVELDDPDRVQPLARALRDAARSTDSWTYVDAVHQVQRLSRRIVEAFVAEFDVLVTPTMACLPPPIGTLGEGVGDDPLAPLLNSYPMAVFSSLFNVTGQPAISVPVHHDDATGLPVGVQLVAAPRRDDLLLQVSQTLEEAHRWPERHPPTAA